MTKRQANVQAPNPLVVSDMTQMAKFVYDFYANKVAAMAEMSSSRLDNPEVGTIKTTTKPEGKQAGQHPSDDRDSDDEMMKDEDTKETQKEDKKEFPKIVNEIASWATYKYKTVKAGNRNEMVSSGALDTQLQLPI